VTRPRHRRVGLLFLLVATGVWGFLLRGFVSTLPLVALSLAGPLLVHAGTRLVLGMSRHAFQSPWYAAGVVAGAGAIAGGLATLLPGAPDRLLVALPGGWGILDARVSRLDAAVTVNDVSLARRLVRRGLGDAVPLDAHGRPVIHRVERAEMLAALLEHGLDPDAPNEDGQTRLMLVQQPDLARLLLAAGADLQARDRYGRAVVDHHLSYGAVRPVLDAHGAGALGGGAGDPAALRGRTDWLRGEVDAAAGSLGDSVATILPPSPEPGAEATVALTLVNPSDEDRLVDVLAFLNDGLLFVSATHGGDSVNAGRPEVVRAIRWPLLALPARSQGRLDVGVIRRGDAEAGSPSARWEIRHVPRGGTETLDVSSPPRADDRVTAGNAGASRPQLAWLLLIVPLGLLLRGYAVPRRMSSPGRAASWPTSGPWSRAA
jgi:hypothetical protein